MKRMMWLDLEMSGLDDTKDVILEVAIAVTDLELRPLERFHRVIYQPPELLKAMDPWCVDHHGSSGLTAACATGRPLEEVEKDMIALVERHWAPEEKVVLCGNSIGTDRRFLMRWMPKLSKRIHYRVLDVSSFKILFKEKWGLAFDKKESHRAIEDVDESIGELAFYLQYIKVDRPSR